MCKPALPDRDILTGFAVLFCTHVYINIMSCAGVLRFMSIKLIFMLIIIGMLLLLHEEMILDVLLRRLTEIDYSKAEPLDVKPVRRYHERVVTDVVSVRYFLQQSQWKYSYNT